MNIQQKIEAFVKLRDHKEAASKAFSNSMKRTNDALARLEVELLEDLKSSGSDSISTPMGTAYNITRASATVKDRDAFFRFALSTRNFELMDIKANKKIVRELQQEGTQVPGVAYSEILAIGVRRGKENG